MNQAYEIGQNPTGEQSPTEKTHLRQTTNIHSRELFAPIERVRKIVEMTWSGTSRDPFPRDVIPTWRKNPPNEDPLALIPNVTWVGHGFFKFRFEKWDGSQFRVRVDSPGYHGWHGFDLRATPRGCVVTHTITVHLDGAAMIVWPVFVVPIHDWCVEALLDRIEEALARGEVPPETTRKMSWRVAISLRAFSAAARVRRPRK